MKSIRYLFRIGNGPSSSHTIGPYRICRYIKAHYPKAIHVCVTLYGSFALTGRGHGTDKTITETLKPLTSKIIFDYKSKVDHPNTMKCEIHMEDGSVETLMAVSPGGGSIRLNGEKSAPEPEVYPEKNFTEIKEVCLQNGWDLVEFVRQREGDEIFDYLDTVFRGDMLQLVVVVVKIVNQRT